MKVVHYHWEAATGKDGVSFAVRGWARAMAAEGLSVSIACEDGASAEDSDEVNWITVPHTGRDRLRAPHSLGPHVSDADLVVIHSAWLWANSRAAAAAHKAGVPYIVMPHGGYDPFILRRRRALKKAMWATIESRIARRAAAAHVFFAAEKPHLEALGYRGPLLIVPNGVSIPRTWSWDGGSGGYLLWLGRLDAEHKGLDLLVEAVAGLPASERPQLRIHGTGWKEGREQLEREIRNRAVQDWIEIRPPVYGDDKWRTLAQATGFVYPSRWEACSISILEAAAIGLPIIATPYPLARFLAERSAAVLVDRSPAGIREGLAHIQDSAAQLGRNARDVARQELSWRAVTRSWIDQVQPLLKG